ncbi:MAG: xanthine dehydrogenase family protein molybdopterin-binding subunit [Chloroflexi bacterium]|nr:xanthine dehydrogenase family protein molybdopterin-binding subunit [Chloroflexota bacterium]
MTTKKEMNDMNRREFLSATASVGGAMVLGFWLPPESAHAQAAVSADKAVRPEPWYRDAVVPEINAWLTVGPDDTVTIRVAQVDLGTGVMTTNAMIVAEELQCDWSKVRSEYASANRDAIEKAPEWTLKVPGNGAHDPAGGGLPTELTNETGVYRRMGVGSSGNVREGRFYMQYAGAEARERLLLAAANEWRVPVSELVAKDSVITHAKTKRKTTYGALAAKAAQTPLPDPSKIKIKPPDQWKLMGTEQKNRDVPVKVTGAAKYAIDIRLPGMLYAAVKCCPSWGGDVKSFNFDAVKNRPGVHSVVRLPLDRTGKAKEVLGRTTKDGFYSGGVAIIADTWWHAKTALDAMPIEWDRGPGAGVSSATLLEGHLATLHEPGKTIVTGGDVDAAMGRAAKIVEATYTVPYVRRARMEPGNATVLVTDNRVDIWVGDQQPQRSLQNAAMLTGVPPANVHLHMCFLGGGYGSSGNGPQAEHAVFIANTVRGRPVKMLWSREEDWGVGTTYSPLGLFTAKAALDAEGWPIAMDMHYCTSIGVAWPADSRGLAMPPYWVPNYRLHQHIANSHVPAGRVRSTGARPNTFYMETFIDELAHAAGKDPYLYRRELIMRNPPENQQDRFKGTGVGGFRYRDDWLKALDMVAKMSGWGTPLPEGWARGIAIDDRRRGVGVGSGRQGTICAQVHTVEVTKRGQVIVHRVDVVFDQGFSLVNPLTVRKNIEGQIAWGYNDALYQEITIQDGEGVEVNFDKYPVARMREYPKEVNIAFMKTNKWIEGVGEEAIPMITPAIYNAVFKVTGKRIRSVPLKNHDLSWA